VRSDTVSIFRHCPWHFGRQIAEVRLVSAGQLEVLSGRGWECRVLSIANDSSAPVRQSSWWIDNLVEGSTIWRGRSAYPVAHILRVRVWDSLNNDVVSLTDTDNDSVGAIWFNSDEIRRYHPKAVIVDGKDKGCVGCSIDDSHQVSRTLQILAQARSTESSWNEATFWKYTVLN
jgi:hypothetical protein